MTGVVLTNTPAAHPISPAAFRRPERPALRNAADQFLLAPWIIEHLPKHRAYVEPFGGALSVLLSKEPSHTEIYNDLDEVVFDYFTVLRDPVMSARLLDLLRLTPYHRRELELAAGWHEDKIERARRLVIRSFMGRDHRMPAEGTPIFRCSLARSSVTQARDWDELPSHLAVISERLRNVAFERLPALTLLPRYDARDTLFFVDPPYRPGARLTRGAKPSQTRPRGNEITATEYRQLLRRLRTLKGMVALLAHRGSVTDRMLVGWTRYDRTASSDAVSDTPTKSLWLNPAAEALRPSPSLFGALAA